jgi:sec-independent protein translocase protein TatC
VAAASKRRRPSQFSRAADGSMTLMEHLRELRSRLFKASLAIVVGLIVGLFFATKVVALIKAPYCDFVKTQSPTGTCQFNQSTVLESFMVNLKIGLYLGLIGAAPVWLYQLWAFIAPGLHRRERRYTYSFAAIATPLFALGAVLAFIVVGKSLPFLLGLGSEDTVTVNIAGYFDFVTSMMFFFGLGFLFPVVVIMLNFAGVVTAKRLLGWWRIAVFLMFVFAAIVTPTPDPFNMTILALSMALLYFGAVGVAFINDRRRGRRDPYANLADDEVSPIEPTSPVDAPQWGGSNGRHHDST